MSALGPRECITTYGTPAVATSGAIAGSTTPPLTSFTIRAPTASAASATAARVVSMLTTAPAPASARTTGSTRRRSSVSSTRAAPGRVDSPPTSTMSAPAASIARPWRTPGAVSWYVSPPENERGVTWSTPTTRQPPAGGSPRTGYGGSDPLASDTGALGRTEAEHLARAPQREGRPTKERLGFQRGARDPRAG